MPLDAIHPIGLGSRMLTAISALIQGMFAAIDTLIGGMLGLDD